MPYWQAQVGQRRHGRAAAITRELLDCQDGLGMRTLIDQQGLSQDAADQRYTRIRTLMARLLPPT